MFDYPSKVCLKIKFDYRLKVCLKIKFCSKLNLKEDRLRDTFANSNMHGICQDILTVANKCTIGYKHSSTNESVLKDTVLSIPINVHHNI